WRRLLTLPALPPGPLLSSPCLNSCMTRPMVLRCRGDGLGMATSLFGWVFLRQRHNHRAVPTAGALRSAPAVSTLAVRGLLLISVSGSATRTEKQSAMEEASERDSTAAGEARQRSKPRPTIAGLKGRAAHAAVLERHAGQHRPPRSTSGHEAI